MLEVTAAIVRFTLISRAFSHFNDKHVSLISGRGVRHYLVKNPRISLGLSQSRDLAHRALGH